MRLREIASRLGRLAGAGTSQALSSLSNVVVVVAVTRGCGPAGLGRYTLAFGAYLIVLTFTRALVSQPLLTLRGKIEAGDSAVNATATITAYLGGAGGVACILVGIGLRRPEFLAVGILMIPLYVQDLLRFAFFQMDQPWRAALLDAVWLLISLASFPIIVSQESPTVALGLWGVGALFAAVPGLMILRVRPVGIAVAYEWWRLKAQHLGTGLVLESIAFSVGSQASLWVIVALLGDGDLGLLKAAQTVLAPAMMAVTGFSMLTIPRMAQSASSPSIVSAVRISGRALVLVGMASTTLYWMGPLITRVLFGPDLGLTRALLLPACVNLAGHAVAVGPVTALMIQHRGGALAIVRAGSMTVTVGAVAAACAPMGIVGAAWAHVVGSFLFALGTAAAVLCSLRNPKADAPHKTRVG